MGVKHELITVSGGEHGLRGADPQVVSKAHERAAKFLREQMAATGVK